MQNTKKPKIFIVEDNKDLLEIYRLRFEVAGFDVVTSETGLDFLTKFQEEKPDIVLLDLMLPEMDGYSVLNSMKDNFQNSDLKKVPVIVWTNLSEDSDITKALSSGATMYLRKSDYNGDDLVEKIKDIMSKGSTS
jgi:DNA-binding response OmpR family regulator